MPSTRLYSCGNTLTNFGSISSQFSRIHLPRGLSVASTCLTIKVLQRLHIGRIGDRLQVHARLVAQHARKLARFIQHEGDAAGHARGEIAAGAAQHDHQALGHVLAAVIADDFDHRRRAGIADREALAAPCR